MVRKIMGNSHFDCFRAEGQWYRGNLHSHTTNSDGYATPEELVDWYLRNGYDFLAITDHDMITDVSKLQREGLLLIPGIEYGYPPAEEPGFYLDMLGLNIKELPEFLDPEKTGKVVYDVNISPQQIIDAVNEAGGMAVMCHPYFMNNMTEPYMKYHSYIGLEVYNFVCDAMSQRGNQEIYWDVLLSRKKELLGFATDDSHAPDFGHGWIEVKAKEKTIPAIMEAIREGNFYATTGVKILDLEYSEEKIKITFDRPCKVVFKNQGGTVIPIYKNESELRDGRMCFYAEIQTPIKEPFVRIILTAANGEQAFTNPLYFRKVQ